MPRPQNELEVYHKTVFAEAKGESYEGQVWVAWTIKNRAYKNKAYWGGNRIRDVCLHPDQFAVWTDVADIIIDDPIVYNKIGDWLPGVYNAPIRKMPDDRDPTKGCDTFNSHNYVLDPEDFYFMAKIGGHRFYVERRP